MIAALARLHTFAPPESWLRHAGTTHRHHVWSEGAEQEALSLFGPADAHALRPRLRALRDAALALWGETPQDQPPAPQQRRPPPATRWISGDPNPTNWGLRDQDDAGSPVLFDWERFGTGPVALDLAITVPGLGDAAAFAKVATVYASLRRAHDDGIPPPDALAPQLALAKCWTAVEFLAAAATKRSRPAALEPLLRAFPAWLADCAAPHIPRAT